MTWGALGVRKRLKIWREKMHNLEHALISLYLISPKLRAALGKLTEPWFKGGQWLGGVKNPNLVLTPWVELIIVWTKSWWWCSFSPLELSSTRFGRRALPNEDFGRLQAQAQLRFPDDGDDGDEDHHHDEVQLLVIMIMTNRLISKSNIIRKWW